MRPDRLRAALRLPAGSLPMAKVSDESGRQRNRKLDTRSLRSALHRNGSDGSADRN